MEQLGFPTSISRATVEFNGWDLPISSFVVHFGFAIAFGMLYCLVAEVWPSIKLWQGAAFGLVVWIVCHLLLMPALGTVPAPWGQPWREHFSEALGHVVGLWSIDIVRRDLRNRITHEPDAEVPLGGSERTAQPAVALTGGSADERAERRSARSLQVGTATGSHPGDETGLTSDST